MRTIAAGTCLLSLPRNWYTGYSISCFVFVLMAGGTHKLYQLGRTDWAFYVMMSWWKQSPVFETSFWIKTWQWIMSRKLVIVWMYHHHILLDLISINMYITQIEHHVFHMTICVFLFVLKAVLWKWHCRYFGSDRRISTGSKQPDAAYFKTQCVS